MGKNIKSYATTQVHFPRGREGSLTANNPNLSATGVIRLNHTHSFFKFTAKFFSTRLFFLNLQQNFSNQIVQSCFELWLIASKLSKIRSIHLHTPRITQNLHQLLTHDIMFQAPAPAENPEEFQRIMQIPRSSPT